MTHLYGTSAAGRRTIVPPRRGLPTDLPDVGMAGALRAVARLEKLAHACRDALAQRDPRGVRRTIGLVFDAVEAIEAGLVAEFPPNDPGQPPDCVPASRGLALAAPARSAVSSERRRPEGAGPLAAVVVAAERSSR